MIVLYIEVKFRKNEKKNHPLVLQLSVNVLEKRDFLDNFHSFCLIEYK